MSIRTEIINRAVYVVKRSSAKDYVPICDYCKKSKHCCEPNKTRRITCPNDTYEGVMT